MSPNLTVKPISDPTRSKDFLDLRRTLYQNDPAAVVPLRSIEKLQMDSKQHPFFQHATMQCFVCYRGHTPVGRIAAIQDHLHNEYYEDKTGFFGFFESVNDQDVVDALLLAAQEWLQAKGADSMRGPVNPSLKNEFGVVVEGNENLPKVMMGHSPKFYDELLIGGGLEVVKRFFCYQFLSCEYEQAKEQWDRTEKSIARILKRYSNFEFRAVQKENFSETIRDINRLGNIVRAENYGFVPLTDPELEFMIKQMKRIIRLDMIHVAYFEGQIVGFIVNIPDVNWALKKTWGKWDWLRMPQLLYWIKKTPRTRVIAFGVHPDFRKKGIALALIKQLRDRFDEYEEWEFSWVVEDNVKSIRAIASMMPLKRDRVYHLYEKAIS